MDVLLSFLREAFLATCEMGVSALITAFVVVLVVMLLRRFRVPQWIPGLLWLLVAVRMLVPVLPVSPVSVMNIPILEDAVRTASDSLREGLQGDYEVAVDVPGGRNEFQEIVDAGVEPETTEFGWRAVFYTRDEAGNILPAQRAYDTVVPVLAMIWAAGVLVFWLFGLVSYGLLLRRLRFAVRDQDVPPHLNVWLSDRVKTPCLVGIFRPKIILPFGMDEKQRAFVLCHEAEHLRHGDAIWKLLGYLLMSVYWYHYFLWMLYSVFLEDLELACDARVLQRLGESVKADYSEALVDFSTRRRMVSVVQIAFGENYTRDRVRSVLRWKKPLRALIVPALAICVLLGGSLLTDARESADLLRGRSFGAVYETYGEQAADTFSGEWFSVTEDLVLYRANAEQGVWHRVGKLKEGRKSDREIFVSDFDASFDASALYDALDQIYVVTEPDDNTVLWRMMTTKDNRVLLAKVEGYLSETAHTAALYRLDTGYYDPPEDPVFPAGTYTGTELVGWGAWYSMTPDPAWVRSLRVTVTDDAFSVSGDPAPVGVALPFEGEQVQYSLETTGSDILSADSSGPCLLSVPAGSEAYIWRIVDVNGTETGWRLIELDGHLYVGYWQLFGDANPIRACCFLAELSAEN